MDWIYRGGKNQFNFNLKAINTGRSTGSSSNRTYARTPGQATVPAATTPASTDQSNSGQEIGNYLIVVAVLLTVLAFVLSALGLVYRRRARLARLQVSPQA